MFFSNLLSIECIVKNNYVVYVAVSYRYISVLADRQAVCEITTGQYVCEHLCMLFMT